MSISPAKPKSSTSSSKIHSAGNPISIDGFTRSRCSFRPSELSMSQSSDALAPSESNGVLAAEGSLEPSKKINEVSEAATCSDSKCRLPSHPNCTNSGITAPFNRNGSSQQNSSSVGPRGCPSQSTGKKAPIVSANHLLNFHYKNVSHYQERAPALLFPRKQQKPRPYNRDLFLQANYKFVLLDTGNYAPEGMDPDKMLTWEDVICVKYLTPQSVECPICLEHPLCPQITSCGHIFCFPCILRYLFGDCEDQKSNFLKKCPLCFVPMCSKDMCTIYLESVKNYCVGDDIEFVLLTRHKGSSVPSNRRNIHAGSNSCCENEDRDLFLKFTVTSDVSLSIAKAKSDLDSWLVKVDAGVAEGLEKLPFVCAALELLEQRKKHWDEVRIKCSGKSAKHTNGEKGSKPMAVKCSDFGSPPHKLPSNDGNRDKHSDDFDSKLNDHLFRIDGVDESVECNEVLQTPLKGTCPPKNRVSDTRDTKINDFYNFYQAFDGQLLILHPLNMKCLLRHYGDYDLLPDRIKGKILQFDTITQSEAMRRRYRYLSHFSLTTTFQICEVDMSGVLPVDSILPFAEEIKKREKQRTRLAKQAQENKTKIASCDTYFIPDCFDFNGFSDQIEPEFSTDDFEALGGSSSTSTSPPTAVGRMLFSNVTKLGYAAGHDSPALQIDKLPVAESRCSVEPKGGGTINNGCLESFAAVMTRKGTEKMERNVCAAKKGKKPAKVLLSTAGSRRY